MSWPRVLLALTTIGLATRDASAQERLFYVDEVGKTEVGPSIFHTPYAFASASYELAFGFAYSETGRWQDQHVVGGTAILTTNGTVNLFGFQRDLQLADRLFMDTDLFLGHFTSLRFYPDGSNQSDPDLYIEDPSEDVWTNVPFKFVLPIGTGADDPVPTYVLDRGIPISGSLYRGWWNPFTTGRTSLIAEPFYRRQEHQVAAQPGQLATNGIALRVEYDNRDFPRNPTHGSRQRISFKRDFGAFDSTETWSVIEAEASTYVPLEPIGPTRQTVLALGFWTADTPTAKTQAGGGMLNVAPYFEGPRLGGLRRLRAYDFDRFHDVAGIHYAAELRLMPDWHPLGRVDRLRPLHLDWWQIVPFAEVGRVAPDWDLSTLHEDMRWDAGLGFRFMALKQIVRLDFAYGSEGFSMVFDFGQPF